MTRRERKYIRLREYDYRTPGYYFITVCTQDRQKLLERFVGADLCVRPPERENFISWWLLELRHKFPTVSIDAACILPDHIHFLLVLSGGHIGPPLPQIVQWYKVQTTNAYICGVKRGELPSFQKRVWQRGYYEHVVRSERELREIREYVIHNALKR